MQTLYASWDPRRIGPALGLGLGLCLWLCGCGTPAERAQARLKRAGIAAEPASLVAAAEAGRGDVMGWLLTAGVSAGAPGRSPLIAAIQSNQLSAAALLLGAGADINASDRDGVPALGHAVRLCSPEAVRLLLAHGAAADVLIRPGEPAIVAAARAGDARLADSLLGHGADPDRRAADGWAALPLAVGRGDERMAIALLQGRADPNLPDPAGQPPLVQCAREGRGTLAALLLRHRANPNRPDATGKTALVHAVLAGDNGAAALLFKHGATAAKAGELLAIALEKSNYELASQLLAHGASPDAPGPDGRAPMEIALERGDTRLARTLLEAGASPHAFLAGAIARRADALLELLLKFKADPNRPAPGGDTPLFLALRQGDLLLLGKLLRHGADPERPAREGQTPLAVAIAMRQSRAARLLLEHKVDPNRPLAEPVSKAFLQLLDGEKLRSHIEEDSGITPLMLAAGLGDDDAVRVLLAHGAKTDVRTTRHKYYPLDIAAEGKHLNVMQLILGKEPASRWKGVYIEISLSDQEARLWVDGKVKMTSPVSTGRSGYRTPKGEYVITNKYRHWVSTLYHVPMPYFMRLNCGSFGLHAGYVPDYPASHGCIRLPPGNARAFYQVAQVGHRVTITE